MIIAEYIWIDNDYNLRSKARTINVFSDGLGVKLEEIPCWNFDGSSTGQAYKDNSEIILRPCRIYPDPFRGDNNILVLCECYDSNNIPVYTNNRVKASNIFDKEVVKSQVPWYGLEQEYVIYDKRTSRPLGWVGDEVPVQGKYYCGVGADRAYGRSIADKHYKICFKMGLSISGMNGEVMPSQWEFQIGPSEGIDGADELWIARYILGRVAEEEDVIISYNPKPEKGDVNGSGCHINFSTKEMREEGGIKYIYEGIEKLCYKHKEHIEVYGTNEFRLTGEHETSNINTFTFGIANRSVSVRIPKETYLMGKGYLEDRRPASDVDPYLATSKLAETLCM